MRQFFREVFSDNGIGSFSNVATGFLLLFAVCWVSFLVIKNTTMPDMTGLAIFIGTLYGVKKAAATISDFKK